jgi:hypothetical protein
MHTIAKVLKTVTRTHRPLLLNLNKSVRLMGNAVSRNSYFEDQICAIKCDLILKQLMLNISINTNFE